MGELLVQRFQITLHGKGACGIVAEKDVMNLAQAVAPRSDRQGRGQIVAELVRSAPLFGIQVMYGAARLLVQGVIGMRGVVEMVWGAGLAIEPCAGVAQRVVCTADLLAHCRACRV